MIICIIVAANGTGQCSKALLAAQNGSLTGACDATGLEVAWRLQYALGIPVVMWLMWLRLCRLKESHVWEKRQDKLGDMTALELRAKRLRDARMLFSRKYFPRLIGCAGGWFVWDVAFYGNKLFQGKIIAVILGGSSSVTLQANFNTTLLNAFVGLCGYYVAAFTMDAKWMGRVRMQVMGFTITTILFLVCGYEFTLLSTPAYLPLFQFLYYCSSFWNQWGPNCTTWLLPVECFPTDIRTQAHGISAAAGKFGALLATLVFSYATPNNNSLIFEISGYACLAGLVITVLFVPNMTGISLHDIDRRWSMDLKGQTGDIPKDQSIVVAEVASDNDKNKVADAEQGN